MQTSFQNEKLTDGLPFCPSVSNNIICQKEFISEVISQTELKQVLTVGNTVAVRQTVYHTEISAKSYIIFVDTQTDTQLPADIEAAVTVAIYAF